MYNRFFSLQVGNESWRVEFVQKWREKTMVWNRTKSKTYVHGPGTFFETVQANVGIVVSMATIKYQKGFSKGIHYWELLPHKCIHKTTVGVCYSNAEAFYSLGQTNGIGCSLFF